ncbi:ABC transporter permease [Dactylosporangium roseum]|uniref:ABC transporter permease n=1 Tax=Dactylosporangium roseum TaxID=47989 RepID=A0ABY5YYK0_9ACTN|nr:ABC transporter permease [Dactylosporangium roseum]UWZ34825.1 ABC transporter permease [Dactylosporangium roseum]
MTAGPAGALRPKARAGRSSLRAGLGLAALITLLSVYAAIAMPDPNEQNLSDTSLPPMSPGHLLGTDLLGRDLLTWCLNGARTSVLIGACVVAISAVIGTALGAVAGYHGGWLDTVLMRLVDLQLAVPPLLIFLAAAMVIDASPASLVLLLSAVGWVPYARLVRVNVLVERERGYVAAARLAGRSRVSILLNHVVPTNAALVVTFASLHIGFVMLAEAALSFLGLGLRPPSPSLGYMIAQGREHLAGAWWIATVPGVMIIVLIVSANLIGDGLRDRFQLDVGGQL